MGLCLRVFLHLRPRLFLFRVGSCLHLWSQALPSPLRLGAYDRAEIHCQAPSQALIGKSHKGFFLPSCQVHLGGQVVPLGQAVPVKKKKKTDNEKNLCNQAENKIKDIIPLAETSRDSTALVAMQSPPGAGSGYAASKRHSLAPARALFISHAPILPCNSFQPSAC